MRKFIVITITVFLATFVLVNGVQAISIGVKPTEINITQKIGEQKTEQLLIKNTGQEPAMYKVYPDKYESNIKIDPSEFKLDSSEEKVINIASRFWWPGNFITAIAVTARPLNIGNAVSIPGVKIPLAIKVTLSYLDYIVILTCLLVIIFALQFKRRE